MVRSILKPDQERTAPMQENFSSMKIHVCISRFNSTSDGRIWRVIRRNLKPCKWKSLFTEVVKDPLAENRSSIWNNSISFVDEFLVHPHQSNHFFFITNHYLFLYFKIIFKKKLKKIFFSLLQINIFLCFHIMYWYQK
jgi:hypothetical protein